MQTESETVTTDQSDLGLHLFAQTCLSRNLGSLRYLLQWFQW